MSVSEQLLATAYKARIVTYREQTLLARPEVARRELAQVEATVEDLKALVHMTAPGHPNIQRELQRGIVANHGPEPLTVRVEGQKVVAVGAAPRNLFGRVKGDPTYVAHDRNSVHTDARAKLRAARQLRNALREQINSQDPLITLLQGALNAFSR